MAGYIVEDTRKVTTVRLAEMKRQGKRIAMLTSYDYSMAQIVDQAGVDVILIGDSAGNVMAGNQTTIPVTLDEMIYHGRCVARAVKRALVVCDMPFGTYHASRQAAVENAVRLMQGSGVDALKLEGGVEILEMIRGIISGKMDLHPRRRHRVYHGGGL